MTWNEATDRLKRRVRPHTIGDQRKVVAASATAEPLESSVHVVDYVIITAETNNTLAMAVGSSTVVAAVATRRGIPLNPGDSVSLGAVDLNQVYIDSNLNGEGVTYLYLK